MNSHIDFDYKCFNDCQQTGCPGHKYRLTYAGSSDTIELLRLGHKDKNGEWVNDRYQIFDKNQLTALANAWEQLKHK